MEDARSAGRTDHRLDRRRLAAASVIALAAAGGLLLCVAHGVLAVSVAGSGGAFKVSGEQLAGDGVTEVTDSVPEQDGTRHPVAVVSAERASVRGLCASLLVPTPLGSFTLRGAAGRTTPAQVTGLMVDSDRVSGTDATFTGLRVGPLPKGGIGVRAGHTAVSRTRFTSWLATAGSFRVHDVDVTVRPGRAECY